MGLTAEVNGFGSSFNWCSEKWDGQGAKQTPRRCRGVELPWKPPPSNESASDMFFGEAGQRKEVWGAQGVRSDYKHR